ncbi:mechanosensitive ion channel family protein [Hyalangium rubrum]|uniref:Mechanosensitive ion channel family protein n=1 Tax=Hyalangium rubrum TaxID=3103134 RepID=A0ABU5GUY7_9BACT|nr:mechanosensitive ion channel family protein [Hyalangium sp. s54d21]MDY7224987.1 mechanosensitive ion channel family protein [Hyalangium sp. s54d21]
MLPFLQSNVSLVIGAVLVVLLFAARAASADKDFRRDLRGAFRFLTAFLIFRLAAWAVPENAPSSVHKFIQVAWMLAFTFGVIRAGVSLALKIVRLRSPDAVPKILRDVIDFSLYGLAALPILQTQLNLDLGGLLATSAVLSVVIGLALQETLGNLFAGLSLQLERPYQVGDFIRIGEYTGRVVQIGWRATRIITFRRESVTLPNSKVAKEVVKNFSYGYEPVAIDIELKLSYEAPPNRVKAAVLEVLREVPNVVPEPRPMCRTWAYEESSVRYQIRYWVASFAHADNAMEEIYSRLWYRLRREGLEPPFPRRVVHMREEAARSEFASDTVLELLRAVDLFALFGEAELDQLRHTLVARRFGRNERIIQEGEQGHTFYLVASGEVSVRTGKGQEVTRLTRGCYFGEMSLLTGEPRAATVVALEDSVLLELDRSAFGNMFSSNPGLARQLSALLAQRRTQLRAVAEAGGGGADAAPEEGRILGRLRQIFGLSHD